MVSGKFAKTRKAQESFTYSDDTLETSLGILLQSPHPRQLALELLLLEIGQEFRLAI